MELVRLVDEVGVDSIIRDKDFENALIVGPAVVAALGGVSLEHCIFEGNVDSLLIEVPENRSVIGVIGLQNTAFRNCRFQNVGFIGPKSFIDLFRTIEQGGTLHQVPSGVIQDQTPAESAAENPPPAHE